jgi:type II secretory pathway pseudopilin PulG
MKPKTYQSDKKTAFTIIELLTVMSIIVILIGLLVPSLNMVKRYAKEVRQRAQFHSIDSALELFNGEWGSYPPSSAMDTAVTPARYCGAMKLCEAMLGQDLMGFHPNSRFLEDGSATGNGDWIYATPTNTYQPDTANLRARKTYLQQTTDAYRLEHLYSAVGNFNKDSYVLCDVYNRVKHRQTGKGIGMPILYYRANTLNTIHDPCTSSVAIPPAWDNDNGYIYNYWDNQDLVDLGVPPAGAVAHPLSVPDKFYEITKDNRIVIDVGRPYRPDSYILISAGFDSIYGTDDDIFNFDKIAGR